MKIPDSHTVLPTPRTRSLPPSPGMLPHDPATTVMIEWDPARGSLVDPSLLGLFDPYGNRIVHHAEFQVRELLRREVSISNIVFDKQAILEAIIAGSDLAARNDHGQTALHTHALADKRSNCIAFFNALRAQPSARLSELFQMQDHEGNTTFLVASEWVADEDGDLLNDCELVHYLRNHFPEVELTVNVPNRRGDTPLKNYLSLIATPFDIDASHLEWLARAGADFCTRDMCGRSLLHICAELSGPDGPLIGVAKLAFDAQVDPVGFDLLGQTPLHAAAFNHQCDETLIRQVVDFSPGRAALHMRDHAGKTPVELALDNGNLHVAHILASFSTHLPTRAGAEPALSDSTSSDSDSDEPLSKYRRTNSM